MKSADMKKKENTLMTFEQAIRLALHTPRLTRKQIDELRKQEKQKKEDKKKN